MHAFSSLLQSAGLLKTLDLCEDDCLFYTIHDSPYRLMSLAVNLGIEYVAYFLVDMSRVRLLWDPFFLMSEEVETVDQNNRILHLVTKPVQLSSFPCAVSARPRDFCVHMHYSYDEDVNAYFILFMSTAHHRCPPASCIVRGTMRSLGAWLRDRRWLPAGDHQSRTNADQRHVRRASRRPHGDVGRGGAVLRAPLHPERQGWRWETSVT